MPCRVVLLIEFLLDVGSNVFLDVKLLHCLCRAVYSVLLHIFGHVCILDNCLTIRHLK
jgi:hypothetical protein